MLLWAVSPESTRILLLERTLDQSFILQMRKLRPRQGPYLAQDPTASRVEAGFDFFYEPAGAPPFLLSEAVGWETGFQEAQAESQESQASLSPTSPCLLKACHLKALH